MPNLESDLALPMVLKKLGLEDQAFLGVHVRLGDSCVKWRELFKGDCIGIMEHIEAISFLTNRYSIAKVFVASDDPSAANIIQEALPHLGVTSVTDYRDVLQEMDKTKEQWTENRLREGQISRGQLLRSTLLDLLILSMARFYVGHQVKPIG